MGKTRIEWCDCVWNPVIGCKTGCSYCYAKKLNNRFKWIPKWDNPIFFPHKMDIEFPEKPSRIFVNSMSDIKFWDKEWMKAVLYRIEVYFSQHTFLFLTKHPEIYQDYVFPKNCWLGVSITGIPNTNIWTWAISEARGIVGIQSNKIFISIEPLLEELTFYELGWLGNFDWVIVGGLTPKPKHSQKCVDEIVMRCREIKTPLFLKDNLHYSEKIREFPKE